MPTRGQRNTQKILGAVAVPSARFVWRHQSEYFNTTTYLSYLEEVVVPGFYRRRHRIYLIQDNASYHTAPEVKEWLRENHRYLEMFSLPAYSPPEFNATERIWQYTRKSATHNVFFETPEDLCRSLFTTFRDIAKRPETIRNLVGPYF